MGDWMTDLQNEGTDFLNRAAMETPNRYNTPSSIPTYATHDAGQGDITRLPGGRTSSSVRQDGGHVQSLGGGQVNGCPVWFVRVHPRQVYHDPECRKEKFLGND